MAYTPTEWETADIVTATRMNALENAVGDMNMSYTPNTWSDGDILTAAKMNALEQAVASGGGGGSSDFSTAEVTLASDFLEYLTQFPLPIIVDGTLMTINSPNLGTYTVPLYHGSILLFNGEASDVSASGSATVIDGLDITVTGDCTLMWAEP